MNKFSTAVYKFATGYAYDCSALVDALWSGKLQPSGVAGLHRVQLPTDLRAAVMPQVKHCSVWQAELILVWMPVGYLRSFYLKNNPLGVEWGKAAHESPEKCVSSNKMLVFWHKIGEHSLEGIAFPLGFTGTSFSTALGYLTAGVQEQVLPLKMEMAWSKVWI